MADTRTEAEKLREAVADACRQTVHEYDASGREIACTYAGDPAPALWDLIPGADESAPTGDR